MARVTARRSAKRTRTVTSGRRGLRRGAASRPGRRDGSAGRNTLPSAASCRAPTARRPSGRGGPSRSRAGRGSRRAPQLLARRRAEQPLQRSPGVCASWPIVVTPIAASLALVAGPTPHISPTGRSCRKASSVRGSMHHQSVGLGDLRADLGEMLRPRDADRDRQAEFLAHPPPDRLRDRRRRAEEMLRAGNIGKGLVDRDPLHQRREVVEDGDRRVAEPLVLLEMAADEDEVRAKLLRLAARIPPRTPNAFAS